MSEVLKELIKPRTLFAGLFYITFCYLVFNKITPPENLTNIVTLILGFYFGNKSKKT